MAVIVSFLLLRIFYAIFSNIANRNCLQLDVKILAQSLDTPNFALNDNANSNSNQPITKRSLLWSNLSQPIRINKTSDRTLLVLFTTFKSLSNKTELYLRTLHNWASLRPAILPVLFTIPSDLDPQNKDTALLQGRARDLGWAVYPAPRLMHDLPVLPDMFAHVTTTHDAALYGYCNGDILFTDDLVTTLRYLVHTAVPTLMNNFTEYFITGVRTNVRYTEDLPLDTWDDVKSAARQGVLFEYQSQDFFISGRASYPWQQVPPFVVGRVGYDNWLVGHAVQSHIPVIDVTETVVSVHLTDEEGNKAGDSTADHDINTKLIPSFNYNLGNTLCVPFLTHWNSLKEPELFYRQLARFKCKAQQYRVHVGGKLQKNNWHLLCPKCRGSV